jgi:hypothetical protein
MRTYCIVLFCLLVLFYASLVLSLIRPLVVSLFMGIQFILWPSFLLLTFAIFLYLRKLCFVTIFFAWPLFLHISSIINSQFLWTRLNFLSVRRILLLLLHVQLAKLNTIPLSYIMSLINCVQTWYCSLIYCWNSSNSHVCSYWNLHHSFHYFSRTIGLCSYWIFHSYFSSSSLS